MLGSVPGGIVLAIGVEPPTCMRSTGLVDASSTDRLGERFSCLSFDEAEGPFVLPLR